LASTSPEEAARAVLAACLEGRRWTREALERLREPDASQALFRGVVEPLADRFEPRLCYA